MEVPEIGALVVAATGPIVSVAVVADVTVLPSVVKVQVKAHCDVAS